MDATSLLSQLRADGYVLERVGERLRVTPGDKLTNALSESIRQHKAALLGLLTDAAPQTAFSGFEGWKTLNNPENPETLQNLEPVLAADVPSCPLCQSAALRSEKWHYERLTHCPDTGHELPEIIRGLMWDIACGACEAVLSTAGYFDDELLDALEARAAFLVQTGWGPAAAWQQATADARTALQGQTTG